MIVPVFMQDFVCKADACQHTCCRGWEIDIDEATAQRYQQLSGELGDMLRANMTCEHGIWHFVLTKEGDCPFLRADGLCRLIRLAGEDILCTICREHPRFYQQVQGQKLAGVGLACEKSVELLLAEAGPLLFSYTEPEQAGTPAEAPFSFAELLAKLGIVCPTALSHWQADLEADYLAFVLETLAMTEPIDAAWLPEITALQQDVSATAAGVHSLLEKVPSGQMQRLYQYIFYRQLSALSGCSIESLAAYAALGTLTICLLALSRPLPDAARRWSEQIEYSQDNVALLLAVA